MFQQYALLLTIPVPVEVDSVFYPEKRLIIAIEAPLPDGSSTTADRRDESVTIE